MQLVFLALSLVSPHIKSGRLRALAVTSAQPSALAPGLPTVAASGLPGFEIVGTDAIYAPAKTPVAVINQLNREIVRFLRTQRQKRNICCVGSEVIASLAGRARGQDKIPRCHHRQADQGCRYQGGLILRATVSRR